jgi:elongation factor Ts
MLSPLRLQSAALASRCYSTQQHAGKASVKLVAELRKLTAVSISKAREALTATNNDVNAALGWLEKDLATSGAKKAAKLQGRSTSQGLISISKLSSGTSGKVAAGHGGIRAAMVELNCETDFVGRNELFGKLAADIAHTAAYISEISTSKGAFHQHSLELLHDAPLLSEANPGATPTGTVATAIRDAIAKLGENIALRRAISVVENPPPKSSLGLRLTSYVHGSICNPDQGRIGGLALLALKSQTLQEHLASEAFCGDLGRLERALARQIVGFETLSIDGDDQSALYKQPFMMMGSDNTNILVKDALVSWSQEKGLLSQPTEDEGIVVLDFMKWTLGESVTASYNPQS